MANASGDEGGIGAAFFDVDGTLVKTTIVHYYMYFRKRQMPRWVRGLWQAAYTVKCLGYLVLDKIDRSRLNVVFYRSYRGMEAAWVRGQVGNCHRDVIAPRCFAEARPCVQEHQGAGRRIVLVTGSIDFIVEPLATELGADHVIAPALVEAGGRFTGALDGPPIGNEEKAGRIRAFADETGIDLSASYAYADSIADLPMLEVVGHPQVVNPDKRLGAVAAKRGWPVHRWFVGQAAGTGR